MQRNIIEYNTLKHNKHAQKFKKKKKHNYVVIQRGLLLYEDAKQHPLKWDIKQHKFNFFLSLCII